ncbi:transposase [Streptomyces sp. NPDC058595]|uniref:transposase n=1 Tax=Streptomyces sp. NPDC058595 TaxID=3346550 RepID=UPI003656404B
MEVVEPLPIVLRHPEPLRPRSNTEFDGHDGPGRCPTHQVVEEDIPHLRRDVHLAAPVRGVRTPVEGPDVAPPEVEQAKSRDDSQVTRLRDDVRRQPVAASPLGVVPGRVVPAVRVPGRCDPVFRRLARTRFHAARAFYAWAAEQDRLTLERLPAYAPELNPVELLWSPLKKRELANLAGDHLTDGIHRINHNPHLPWSFLAHTGLTIHPAHPPNLRKDQ